jgi:hypothetical protein
METTTMKNNLSESIKKKISDEAEAASREREKTMKEAKRIPYSSEYCDGWADGYEEAANKIMGNPGDYGLAGVLWIPVEEISQDMKDASFEGGAEQCLIVVEFNGRATVSFGEYYNGVWWWNKNNRQILGEYKVTKFAFKPEPPKP